MLDVLIDDLKRCSCKKLAKARFDYFHDGPHEQNRQFRNKNENIIQHKMSV